MNKLIQKLSNNVIKCILIAAGILVAVTTVVLIVNRNPAADAGKAAETLAESVQQNARETINSIEEKTSEGSKENVASKKNIVSEEEYLSGNTDVRAEEQLVISELEAGAIEEEANEAEASSDYHSTSKAGSGALHAGSAEIDDGLPTESNPAVQTETEVESQVVFKTIVLGEDTLSVPEEAPENIDEFNTLDGADKYNLALQFDTVEDYNKYITLLNKAGDADRIDFNTEDFEDTETE